MSRWSCPRFHPECDTWTWVFLELQGHCSQTQHFFSTPRTILIIWVGPKPETVLIPITLYEFHQELGPFLRSATHTDFPRPARSQRLAATDFILIKAVNWLRFLPKMFIFLIFTEKTKSDFAHILIFTHILVLTHQQSRIITSYIMSNPRENGSENRFLSRVRSAAKRECEP